MHKPTHCFECAHKHPGSSLNVLTTAVKNVSHTKQMLWQNMLLWDAFVADHPVHACTTATTVQDARQDMVALEAQGGACHGVSFVEQHTFCVASHEFMKETGDGELVYIDWPFVMDADVIDSIQVQGAEHVSVVCGASTHPLHLDHVNPLTFIHLNAQPSLCTLRLYWHQKPVPSCKVQVSMCKTLYCESNKQFIADYVRQP